MFVIKTQEKQAGKPKGSAHRVLVFRDDVLHYIHTWDVRGDDAYNHRNAAQQSLLKSSDGNWSPHHVLGAAPVPGQDFWVVAVEEGK